MSSAKALVSPTAAPVRSRAADVGRSPVGFTVSKVTGGPDERVLSLGGSLDAAGAEQFAEEFEAVLAEHPPTLILDLSQVDFVGVGAIRALIAGAQAASERGVVIRVVPGPAFDQALSVCEVAESFESDGAAGLRWAASTGEATGQTGGSGAAGPARGRGRRRAEGHGVRRSDSDAASVQALGMAAHGLRNPLTAIQGLTMTLHRDLADRLEGREDELFDRLEASCAHAVALVADLLDFAVSDPDRMPLQREPIDAAALLLDVVEQVRPAAERKDVHLDVSMASSSVTLELDRLKIMQALDNLLVNAVKHSPLGATVSASATVTEGSLAIAFRDRGEGVSAQDRERLLQPFSGWGRTGTAGERSTGFGLVVAQRMVQAHGGFVTVDSTPGEGSVFTVHLPLGGSR